MLRRFFPENFTEDGCYYTLLLAFPVIILSLSALIYCFFLGLNLLLTPQYHPVIPTIKEMQSIEVNDNVITITKLNINNKK